MHAIAGDTEVTAKKFLFAPLRNMQVILKLSHRAIEPMKKKSSRTDDCKVQFYFVAYILYTIFF